MENYMHSLTLGSSRQIGEVETRRLSGLLSRDKGIENFRITPEGIYLEYNTYLYSQNQVEEILSKNGFSKKVERKPGFLKRQIRNIGASNKQTYGDRNPHCCG